MLRKVVKSLLPLSWFQKDVLIPMLVGFMQWPCAWIKNKKVLPNTLI